jgi:hypothetical protein
MEDLGLAKPRLALLLDEFAEMKDERSPGGSIYPLRDVLFPVVCATIAVSRTSIAACRAPTGCARS